MKAVEKMKLPIIFIFLFNINSLSIWKRFLNNISQKINGFIIMQNKHHTPKKSQIFLIIYLL